MSADTQEIIFVDYNNVEHYREVKAGHLCCSIFSASDRLHIHIPNKSIKKLIIPSRNKAGDSQGFFIELRINSIDIEEVEIYVPIEQLVCRRNSIKIFTKYKIKFILTNSKTFFRNFTHITKMFSEIYLKY